ncbi:MAG: hypothetical protein H0X62_12890, partial [Bacteroidetes bacterium]|nr:hypothetical protein [Bacteroidota bacterium]
MLKKIQNLNSRFGLLFLFAIVASGFNVNSVSAQMAYVSSEVLNVSPPMIGVNTLQGRVAVIRVVTSGTGTLNISQISIGTGNTNLANIDNAQIFYTGSTLTFNNTDQFGLTLAASTSALNFTGNASLGTGNNYFWVTYDIPATAQEDTLNVVVNSITVGGIPQVPSPNQPTIKRYIKTPFSGTYTIGTGGDFALLSIAVSNLNTRGLSGNTDFKIISDINETTSSSMIEWPEIGVGNYTLTISPDSAVLRTISTSGTTLLLMSGADRVIIDGRHNGSGKYLMLQNTNGGQSICVFFNTSLSNTNGCNNSVLRNCILSSGTTTHTFAINVQIGATGHNNLLITENECRKGYYGVSVGVPVGASQANSLYNGIVISNNIIGGTLPGEFINNNGIRLWNTDGAILSNNEIRNIQTASAINNAGIDVTNNSINATVSGNKIYSIRNSHASGYGSSGIALTGGDGHLVYNNLIYDVDALSFSAGHVRSTYGIRVSTGANHQIYHNSISLSGTSTATAANASHGIGLIGGTIINLRNNIIENKQTGPIGFKSYGYYQSAASSIAISNHNNYFVDGSNAILAYLSGSDRATLADVQTATMQDVNSFFGNPDFDANWVPQSCFANNTAEPILNITTDINGITRDSMPDMGAIEYSPVLPNAPTVTSPMLTCMNDAPAQLTASVANAANWYVSANGGTGVSIAPTPSTSTAGNTSFWVSDTISST